MGSVTKVEQARALPEIQWAGQMRMPFSPSPIDGAQIIAFVDADGRAMTVVEGATGPMKMEWL